MKIPGLPILVLFASLPPAWPQSASSTIESSLAASTNARKITLGDSVVELEGDWKFQPGDSPWVNGAPLWAQPGFDDAHWDTLDLTPKDRAKDLSLGTSGYLPGWTRKGYPKLTGYAWYRLRLLVNDPSEPLWIEMPGNFDDIYQIYANGIFVGQYGGFSGNHLTLYYAQPAAFALPTLGPSGEMVLALRFYMSPAAGLTNPNAGGMHGVPALGFSSSVQLLHASAADTNLHAYFSDLLELFLFLLIAPLALGAWLYNRQERAWFWLFLAFAWIVVREIETNLATLAPVNWAFDIVLSNIVGRSLQMAFWLMFWWNWFGLQEKSWIPRAAWLLAALRTLALVCTQAPNLGFSILPHSSLYWANLVVQSCSVALAVLLAVILVEGYRQDHAGALMAALPILLLGFAMLSNYLLAAFGVPNKFFPFGLGIGVGAFASILLALVIGALALRRFIQNQVRESLARQAIRRDLEQAQQLQTRVLVPESISSTHFTVDAQYRPAQTVSGDFFQTLTKPDGTLLVVIGDVSGKGVSASMLVAVLVGAIRTRAEECFEPVSMLATLNRRLIGRSGDHFATCIAAEIHPDGNMRIANAGHLPPYLNGKEMELEGTLPLGLAKQTDITSQAIHLRTGDRLTFITDGVVEATNYAKELFGFVRTREISRAPAASIVEQVEAFGQADDITVVVVDFAA
jgi:hypothetical protein